MNFCSLIAASSGSTQSIQDIIDQSSAPEDSSADVFETPPTSEAAGSSDSFAIQAGTFFKEADANDQVIDLNTKGIDAYIFQSVNSKGDSVYATRIGKFSSYQAAWDEKQRLDADVETPLLITQFESLKPVEAGTAGFSLSDRTGVSAGSMGTPATTESWPASAPDSTPDLYAFTDKANPLTALQEKIESLEREVQKLRDETGIREQLQVTEEEIAAEEEDILEAAGREYTLTREGNIKLSYGISYSYSGYDAIRASSRVEDVADHTIRNSLGVSYGLKDNFTVGTSIPFIYKYHDVGTIDSMDVSDLGDLSLSWKFQPFKTTSDKPSIILNGNFGIPVGRSPYEIQVGEELSTASGIYDANFGASISQTTDPVVVFSSVSVSYPFAVQSINQKRGTAILDEIDPGMGIGVGLGMAYALSYKLNINMSFSYSYSFETTYKYENAPDAESGTSTSASIRIGVGYKLRQNQNLNFSIGIPITSTRSFSIGMSTPIDFEL